MTRQQLLEEYVALPEEAQRQVDDFVAFLRQRHKTASSVDRSLRVVDLDNQPFVGMWRDRQDMEDATAWVRNIRRTEWGEKP